jgi:hypothetical protein
VPSKGGGTYWAAAGITIAERQAGLLGLLSHWCPPYTFDDWAARNLVAFH